MRSMAWLVGVTWLTAATSVAGQAGSAAPVVRVTGRIAILEKNNKPTRDLGDAVVYLEAGAPAPPRTTEIGISRRTYSPRVVVVPVGSTVRFPNFDSYDHNVFSTEPEAFDLGLYGRGEAKANTFGRAGLARIYCNVHPRMVAYVMVVAYPFAVQPQANGEFAIDGVPPGRYKLHAWHERVAAEVVQDVSVGPEGRSGLEVQLDARGYRWRQHKNKLGEDYGGNVRERY